MNWYLGFAAILCILFAAAAAAITISLGKHRGSRVLTPLNIIFGGVFLSVFVCLLPIYSEILSGTTDRTT